MIKIILKLIEKLSSSSLAILILFIIFSTVIVLSIPESRQGLIEFIKLWK